MAFITLSGTLLDPNGDLAVGDQIRFTHKSTTGETVESAVSIITVNPAGTYSLPLQYGLVLVEYKDARKSQFKNLGVATVNGTNPATSIPELLNALVPVSSAELIEFQGILADCVTAQTAAELAEANAAASAASIDPDTMPIIFDTVGDYEAHAFLLTVGKVVKLLDRGAEFTVIAGTGTGNTFNIIASTSVSQSVALIEDGTNASLKEWGGVTDVDAVLIIEAMAQSGASRINCVGVNNVILSRTAVIPVGVYITGTTSATPSSAVNKTTFKPVNGSTDYYETNGTQTANGFLFFMNVDPLSPATWVQQFPNVGSGGISNCTVNGTDAGAGGIKLAYFAGSYEFDNIRNTKVSTLVNAVDSLYQDHIKITRIFSNNRINQTDNLIYLNCLGDSLIIDDCSSGYTGNQVGITKGIFLGPISGGRVTNIINGIINTFNSKVAILEASLFGGYLIIDGGDVTVKECQFGINQDGEFPIRVKATNASFGERYKAQIDNCRFIKTVNPNESSEKWPTAELADIKIDTANIQVTLGSGNHRVATTSGAQAEAQMMGIIVEESSGSITTWQEYSHILSNGASISGRTPITGTTPNFNKTFGGFSGGATEVFANATFADSTATYFYGIQLIVDPARKLGRTASTPEVSIAAVNGSDSLPVAQINYSGIDYRDSHMLRVYRGGTTGNYDKFVDIPVISLRKLIDDGNALNGFPWRFRTTGPLDTLNSDSWTSQARWMDNIITIYGTTGQPNTGTWMTGDEALRTNTSIDGNNMLLHGYKRLINGSAHVSGTDWATMQISTVSPAT